jgi:hypothetical protein
MWLFEVPSPLGGMVTFEKILDLLEDYSSEPTVWDGGINFFAWENVSVFSFVPSPPRGMVTYTAVML